MNSMPPTLISQSYRYLRSAILGLLLLNGSVMIVWGVDPLPPEIEAASEEEQTQYRERLARESLAEKIQVGYRRHVERIAFKEALIQNLQQEAEAKIDSIRHHQALVSLPTQSFSIGKIALVVFIGLGIAYLAYCYWHVGKENG